MVDIVDKATGSLMMAGIKSKNTKPELIMRKGLFARGLRFRLHVKELLGKPDLVFPKYKMLSLFMDASGMRMTATFSKFLPAIRNSGKRNSLAI